MAIATTEILLGLNALVADALAKKIRELADAGYLNQSFDQTMAFLSGKVHVVEEPLPLAALPWCNVIQPGKCRGLTRGRHRLYTQCQGNQVDGDYCKKCARQVAENGTLTCGTVDARMASDPMEYMNVQPFVVAMEQNGWTPDYVRYSVAHHGGTLDERNFEKVKKKTSRGRPQTQTPMAGPELHLPAVVDFGSDDEEAPAAHASHATTASLIASAIVEPVEPRSAPNLGAAEEEEEEPEEPEEEEKPTAEQINKMNKTDLTALCVKYNISTTGVTKVSDVKKAAIAHLHG